jgi:hypothetical protein
MDPPGNGVNAATCGPSCFGWQTAHSCAVWCFTGSNHLGQVFLTQSLVCACGAPAGTWN